MTHYTEHICQVHSPALTSNCWPAITFCTEFPNPKMWNQIWAIHSCVRGCDIQ